MGGNTLFLAGHGVLAFALLLPWVAAVVASRLREGPEFYGRSDAERRLPLAETCTGLAALSFSLLGGLVAANPGSFLTAQDAANLVAIRSPLLLTAFAALVISLAGALTARSAHTRIQELVSGIVASLALGAFLTPLFWIAATLGPAGTWVSAASGLLFLIVSVRLCILVMSDSRRRAWLATAERRARDRSLQRWELLGVPAAMAVSLFEDSGIGNPDDELGTTAGRVQGVVGDFGLGKTLAAERVIQKAAAAAVRSWAAPVPVFLAAIEIEGPLEPALAAAIAPLGLSADTPVILVIDGLDEVGNDRAGALVSAARLLARERVGLRVILTMRPWIGDVLADSVFVAQPLSPADAWALMERVAGRKVEAPYSPPWPSELRETLRVPLLAVLAGVYLRENPAGVPEAPKLIEFMVTRGLAASHSLALTSERVLRLGAAVVDRGGPVAPADIGSAADVQDLLRTRLVTEHGGGLTPSVPVLVPWFAAQALGKGLVDLRDVLADPGRADRWRPAMEIALSVLDYAALRAIVPVLVHEHPALATKLLGRSWTPFDVALPIPDALESARRIRDAMEEWLEALAEVPMIGPRTSTGTLGQIGALANGPSLVIAWRTDIDAPAIVDFTPSQDWATVRSGVPAAKATWPWTWALDSIQHDLDAVFDPAAHHLLTPHLEAEVVWRAGLELSRKGSHYQDPLDVAVIADALRRLPAGAVINVRTWLYGRDWLLERVDALAAAGLTTLVNPNPGRDLSAMGGWVWGGYSPERLLERTHVVFREALRGFEEVFVPAFPRLSRDLPLAALLPLRIVGFLRPDTGGGLSGSPGLIWHAEPLPPGALSTVDITLGPPPDTDQVLDRQLDLVRRLRPGRTESIEPHVMHQSLRIFGAAPATHLLWEWISHELSRAGVTSRDRMYFD